MIAGKMIGLVRMKEKRMGKGDFGTDDGECSRVESGPIEGQRVGRWWGCVKDSGEFYVFPHRSD